MTTTLTMPVVGETVTEGTVERWLKKPGDHVDKYEPIVEINTDKVDVELPSPVTGTVKELLAEEGAIVAVGMPLAIIEEVAGETATEAAAPAPAEAAAPAPAPPARVPAPGGRGEARSTPRVRRLAQELGVDLSVLQGSGPRGRIVEDDVRAFAVAKTPAAPAAPGRIEQEEETVPLTPVRRTIAQRMAASKLSAPHAWLMMEADVTGLVRLREAAKGAFRQREGVDLTYLPFVVAAAAQGLRENPALNASWSEDGIVLKKRIHLGIAVAAEQGLLVPVVHDADRLGVTALARAIHDVSQRAREGKLKLEDVQGGTFTVDNTGWFGSIVSMPIINLGQAAILALEAITKRPVVRDDDAIAVRSVVNLCLSFDHRILDGAQAAAFLQSVVQRLEGYGPDSSLE
ncbi:MAG TPA: dihydrolipoamide acetyltransferase family protein [Dehalococcoidia bacterium]|nr:dihydrolipoamide acetyltransferase family protein [Dehalococcoidia bacterium]